MAPLPTYPEVVTLDQAEFEIRCEWGLQGLRVLAPISDVVIIVDVLSFSTAVDIGAARGAVILPYPRKDLSAEEYARSADTKLASSERGSGYSLSPASLCGLPEGYRLVLPSPNGGALSLAVSHASVLTACLRNAGAAARAAGRLGRTVAVIPAGEMWEDGSMRPSLEDWIGAGAVIAHLAGRRSPEAQLAAAAFEQVRPFLAETLRRCSSGKELIERGFAADVELAGELNVSNHSARMIDGAFVRAGN